ncbi:betaine/proline/choline family ABC transporter ATP-binding protein [Aminobacter anthyllidis]|uniref:betaine/proline/choline family ABC transporter ATP-binding protein n=1 Tax=Aminobacter anthyllidis TaxID=1035067 RepID=UPI0030836362
MQPDDIRKLRESGAIIAAADVSFDVNVGEILVLMGLSGSGKSTVLRCISQLVQPSAGTIRLDGECLSSMSPSDLVEVRRHKMGMVFQNFGLLPHLTVVENVEFPLKVQRTALAVRRERALEMVALVGLAGKENAYPYELSGGQQQRVGIARSLASEPDLWLLDEPFSALDPLIRRQLQEEFLRLQRDLKKTIVFVTHDIMEALRVGDRIAIMKDGLIVQIGTPQDIVLNPVNEYVARFTAEVPRYRVQKVGCIMEGLSGDLNVSADLSTALSCDMAVEDAFEHFRDRDRVPVVDADGRLVGQLTASRIVNHLAKN